MQPSLPLGNRGEMLRKPSQIYKTLRNYFKEKKRHASMSDILEDSKGWGEDGKELLPFRLKSKKNPPQTFLKFIFYLAWHLWQATAAHGGGSP